MTKMGTDTQRLSKDGKIGVPGRNGDPGLGRLNKYQMMWTGIIGDGDLGRLKTEMRKMGLGMGCWRQD